MPTGPRNPFAPVLRRIALATQSARIEGDPPPLRRLLGELDLLAEPIRRPFRKLPIATATEPQVVMLLPGFIASPLQMRYLARQIERAGHQVKNWGAGFNLGASPRRVARLEARLEEIHRRYQQPIVLIGWSLGGIFAREMAHRYPAMVGKVITMGSPIDGDKRSNNAWRAYQLIAGHSIDALPVQVNLDDKPPVETVAMWSATDGIIPPHSARGHDALSDRQVEVQCTHIGFSYAPDAIVKVLKELDRG